MLIKPSDTLNSGFNERIYLKYPDQTKVELNPSTSAILVKSYTSKEMQLLNGSIKLSVTPQQEDTPMIVQSAYASVRISEGVTIISLLGDMDSILVLSGSATVEHANGTDTKTVTAGNFLTLDQEQFFEIEKIKKEKRETSDE